MDESFEIRVRNHKKEAVTVRVVEHLYRWTNWKLSEQSQESRKTDAQTVEFPVTIAPDGETGGDLHRALFVVGQSAAAHDKPCRDRCPHLSSRVKLDSL